MIKSNAWVDSHKPETIEQCFLPSETKTQLNIMLENNDVPSMLFAGPPGIGKTTTAEALCKQLDLEYMLINASLHGNIDTVRTDIHQFASTISFNGNKKVIILDEADGISAAAQASLRGVINEFTNNVAFILTANSKQKIIEPLISRLQEVEFLFSKAELPTLAMGLYKFLVERMEAENVTFDPKAIQHYIRQQLQTTTDIRKLIIGAQQVAKTGVFNLESLISVDDSRLDSLIQMIKSKNFDKIRTWAGENSDIEMSDVCRYVYNNLKQVADKESKVPMVIECINRHQFQHAFVVDKEINLVAMLAEISLVL